MDLREQLEAIRQKHGRLTPAILKDEARADDHPLHSRIFDRPPDQAAEAWYEHRARELIRSVKITYSKADKLEEVRYYVSVRRKDGYAYEPTEEVAQDEVLTAIVLRDMEREWRQLFTRYSHFKEFVEMVRRDVA